MRGSRDDDGRLGDLGRYLSFVQGENPTFVDDNLIIETFERLRLNLVGDREDDGTVPFAQVLAPDGRGLSRADAGLAASFDSHRHGRSGARHRRCAPAAPGPEQSLEQAVKLTKSGSIAMHCSVEHCDAQRVNLRIAVQDTGIGIAAGHDETASDAAQSCGGPQRLRLPVQEWPPP